MSKGIFTAVSGAIAQSAKLDTIANNLANVNTPGFKRDQQVFKEYLTAYEKEPSTITVPRVPASIESFYDAQGGDKSYVDSAGTFTNFDQGSIKLTGNQFDMAIDGDGLFEVSTPQGVRYTRSGDFTVNSEGTLVTKQGFPVLKDGGVGAPAAGREIKFDLNHSQVSVSPEGSITNGDQDLGRIAVVKVTNKDSLKKVGSNMYMLKDNMQSGLQTATESKVLQNALEGSNVNIVREMTDMIATTRVFESTQKVIQAYDSMNGKAVNEISKLK